MIQTIMVATISAVLSGLLTFFVTIMISRKAFEDAAVKAVQQHEAVHHQGNVFEVTKDAIREHREACPAPATTAKLHSAMLWIVSEMGGDPKQVGLI